MNGFASGQETKYSAEQSFQGQQQEHHPPASETPPASAAAYQQAAAGADIFSRYKLEQTIRQLHGIHSADQRPGFGGTPFTGV
jgi:hypothetical protein